VELSRFSSEYYVDGKWGRTIILVLLLCVCVLTKQFWVSGFCHFWFTVQ